MRQSKLGEEISVRPRTALPWSALLLFGLIAVGCGDSTTSPDNFVSVDQVFWQAYSDPDNFDQWLAGQSVEPGAAACFRSQSSTLRAAEQQRLQECFQLVTGSAAWNECHDDADSLGASAAVMGDIARTLDGTTRFADTTSGSTLILTKSLIGDADWNVLTSALRTLLDEFPPLQCG